MSNTNPDAEITTVPGSWLSWRPQPPCWPSLSRAVPSSAVSAPLGRRVRLRHGRVAGVPGDRDTTAADHGRAVAADGDTRGRSTRIRVAAAGTAAMRPVAAGAAGVGGRHDAGGEHGACHHTRPGLSRGRPRSVRRVTRLRCGNDYSRPRRCFGISPLPPREFSFRAIIRIDPSSGPITS